MRTVAVAGASGRLGHLIVAALRQRGAQVVALVRAETPTQHRAGLEGATLREIDFEDGDGLAAALAGADCVVSALNGLHVTIVEAQARLLQAAVTAGATRFVPSDYAADFMRLKPGENRNFDLRRDFRARLLEAPIASTSVLIGAFMELLVHSPMIDWRQRRVGYWGTPDQPLDYTTMPDTAAIVAAAALDPDAPPTLRIVGDRVTVRQLADIAGDVAGGSFSLQRQGSLEDLQRAIEAARTADPEAVVTVFPRFQQLQYIHNMQSGRALLQPLDNGRYDLALTGVRAFLADHRDELGG